MDVRDGSPRAERGRSRRSGFRAGFLELVNIEEGVRELFQLAQSIPRPCVPGRILLDLLMDPPDPADPIARAVQEHRVSLCQALSRNARRVQDVLGSVPGIRCPAPAGGPRALLRVQGTDTDRALSLSRVRYRRSEELPEELPGVFPGVSPKELPGVFPGSHFGLEGGSHLGLSLLLPPQTLERVLLLLTRCQSPSQPE
ncbi:alanine aminotransferase 2-like [Pseudopipra pipra]|uniref:alanine aminotransferase 2-like n=1 Tax=Pseudopipra pipra TaxID=415032 RepID=UPI003139E4F8